VTSIEIGWQGSREDDYNDSDSVDHVVSSASPVGGVPLREESSSQVGSSSTCINQIGSFGRSGASPAHIPSFTDASRCGDWCSR